MLQAQPSEKKKWKNACRLFGTSNIDPVLHVCPLLGNGLVNTFLQKQTCGTVGQLLLVNGAVNTHL
jgi:hypothetical protein